MKETREAFGLLFVVNDAIPAGEALLVPNPPRRPHESEAAHEARRLSQVVRLINIKTPE